MKKCNYCGRENSDESLFCNDCGTELSLSPPSKTTIRPMNIQERKRAWRAVAVTFVCAAAEWLVTWNTHGRWDFLKSFIFSFGFIYAITQMTEIRKARTQTGNAESKNPKQSDESCQIPG
jgi:zinc ribbon protein